MKGVHATYLFEVEEGLAWRLRVDDGVAQIHEGAAEADCIIKASDHDMVLALTGQQNLLTGMLQGRFTIRGDMALAQRFHGALSGQFPKQKQRRA
jgi:putative sterol carrier protein